MHVIGTRRLARTIHRSCVTCHRATAHTQQQLMGQLPASRTTPTPPFSICGVDYTVLKKGHTRRPVIIKCYLAIFVCFSSKAVHLEIVSDATAKSFLDCLKCFISRRGYPQEIHSDNGGNFIGARNELNELYRMLESTFHPFPLIYFVIESNGTPPRKEHLISGDCGRLLLNQQNST